MTSLIMLSGHVGMFMMLFAYLLLIMGKIRPIDLKYLLLNFGGAVMLIVAMMTHHEMPVVQSLIAWLLISFYGFFLHHVKN